MNKFIIMKKLITLIFLAIISSSFAQNELVLRLNHSLNGAPFSYNQVFQLNGDNNIMERLQYYLSTIDLTHDGGQNTNLNDVYVLASGHVTDYYLGNFNISNIESISFDVGVDYTANHGNTTNYPTEHPLGPQSPSMDWGWPSGYFFVVINGKVDSNSDGTPNDMYQLHALGDQMLTSISPISITPQTIGDTTFIDLTVHTERFLNGLDLVNVGIDHSSSPNNLTMCTNAATMNVFEAGNALNTTQNTLPNDYIHIDYTLPFAPTINYHFENRNKIHLSIYDINGKEVLSQDGMVNQGSYFPLKEFSSGIYIVKLNNGINSISKKFTVVQ